MTRTLPILIPLAVAAGAMVTTLCVADFTADGMRVPLWWMGLQGLAAFGFSVAIANLWMDRRASFIDSQQWHEPITGLRFRVNHPTCGAIHKIEMLSYHDDESGVPTRPTEGGAE